MLDKTKPRAEGDSAEVLKSGPFSDVRPLATPSRQFIHAVVNCNHFFVNRGFPLLLLTFPLRQFAETVQALPTYAVFVEPVAVEPVRVEPVRVESVRVEPVAVEPVAV
jgi:hypothetical protein